MKEIKKEEFEQYEKKIDDAANALKKIIEKNRELEAMLKHFSKKELWNRIQEKIANIYEKEFQIQVLKQALENACDELNDCCDCVHNSEYFINCATKEIRG